MKLQPGRNDFVFQALRKKAENMTVEEKIVVIVMDEMFLNENLYYDKKSGRIVGVEDYGVEVETTGVQSTRTPKFANHATLFLLRTVKDGRRLPLQYAFSSSTIAAATIQRILKNLTRDLGDMGFTVIGVVCDQGPTNNSALNKWSSHQPPDIASDGRQRDSPYIIFTMLMYDYVINRRFSILYFLPI